MRTKEEAAKRKDAINLLLLGEFLGLPIMATPIVLKILPYVLPEIEGWKVRQLRERDLTDDVPDVT